MKITRRSAFGLLAGTIPALGLQGPRPETPPGIESEAGPYRGRENR